MKATVIRNYSQKRLEIMALMSLAALVLSTTARAQVIAQDDFSEGTVGNEIFETGTAGSGWANEWADKNNLDRVQSGPLGYTDGNGTVLNTSSFSSSPNSLQSYGAANPGTSSSEPERTLSSTIGADALANTADADTMWVSFLWQGNNTSATGSLFRQASFMFLSGASSSSTSPGGTELMDIGMPNISSTTVSTLNPNISMWFANGNVPTAIPSTAPLQSTWAANNNQTYFILVELTGAAANWSTTANGGAGETVNVWVDPLLNGATPTESADLTYTGQNLAGVNAIRIQGGGYNATYGTLPGEETVGSVIFGDTIADVEPGFLAPVPEPGTLALAGLGGLGLLAFRRRK
jgi:hypothetical protein